MNNLLSLRNEKTIVMKQLITLTLFGDSERELIKSGFGFGLDLTEGNGMA